MFIVAEKSTKISTKKYWHWAQGGCRLRPHDLPQPRAMHREMEWNTLGDSRVGTASALKSVAVKWEMGSG